MVPKPLVWVTQYLENRGFPSTLTSGQIQTAYYLGSKEFQEAAPVVKIGQFRTVVGKNTYDIFNNVTDATLLNIQPPTIPTCIPQNTGGSLADNGVYYVGITYQNSYGESILSPLVEIDIGESNNSNSILVEPPPADPTGIASGWNIYCGTTTQNMTRQNGVGVGIEFANMYEWFGSSYTIQSLVTTKVLPPAISSECVDVNGMRVLECMWNPHTDNIMVDDINGIDVFGIVPYLQNRDFYGGQDFTFATPSDWEIFSSNLDDWRKRFGKTSFEQISNGPGAPMQIAPVPHLTLPVIVYYTAQRSFADYTPICETPWLYHIEAACCDILTRITRDQAGIRIGSIFEDKGLITKFWEIEARIYRERAHKLLGDYGFYNWLGQGRATTVTS